MAIAVIATLLNPSEGNWGLIVLGVALGTAVGVPAARQVKMTAMPQMVALFNGVGGGAVFLISWAEFRLHRRLRATRPTYVAIFSLFAAIVGSVSFWGSNIAFGKLQEIIPGRPITLGAGAADRQPRAARSSRSPPASTSSPARTPKRSSSACWSCAALLGNAVVLPIGGADMPVVISLLNAFTGLSAAATGIALNNPALIVAGMIVGASGSILTNLMAVAMNRSIPAIVAGGFGGGGAVEGAEGAGEHAGTVRSTSAADAAIQLAYANRVVIVPGYGMAVAQAQHAVRELTKELEKRGVEVSYAIHPVAGRMPGHMNVLLAEADVPYDQLKEMDDANPEFQRTDVSLVIGANDVTNPAAKNTPSSPIYGMPILEVADSHSVIVIKRSMNPGFAGIENELYYDPKTAMLFGDAKSAVTRDHRRARRRSELRTAPPLRDCARDRAQPGPRGAVARTSSTWSSSAAASPAPASRSTPPRAATASRCSSAPTTPRAPPAARASSSTAACATCRTSTSGSCARRCSSAS